MVPASGDWESYGNFGAWAAVLDRPLPGLVDRAATAFGHGAGATAGVRSGVGALVIEEA